MKLKIEQGKKYNRWTAIKESGKDRFRNITWLCQCECGQKRNVRGAYLIDGRSASCGCFKNELIAKRSLKHGATVNRDPKAEYSIWTCIKDRCYNPRCTAYEHYGGRGIKMCDSWFNSFESFYCDMGQRPSKKHSVERINNDGDYAPSNCKWATQKEQSRNKRSNHWIEFNGERLILADWAIRLNTTSSIIKQQLIKKPFSQVVAYYSAKKSLPL